jgi:hypothetical protein
MLMPRHGALIAYLALFVALGGTSVAAVGLTRNSVKSTHIKNGQVKRADLARSSVNSSKVADGSLLAGDFAAGQLKAGPEGPRGLEGPRGPAGAAGTDGADGTDGAPGPAAVAIRGRPPNDGTVYSVSVTPEWRLKLSCFYSGSTNDFSMSLVSNSIAADRRVSTAFTATGGTHTKSESVAAGDVSLISYSGSGDDNVRWDGQILHSSSSGVASVTFNVFAATGSCGIDGVGVVSG